MPKGEPRRKSKTRPSPYANEGRLHRRQQWYLTAPDLLLSSSEQRKRDSIESNAQGIGRVHYDPLSRLIFVFIPIGTENFRNYIFDTMKQKIEEIGQRILFVSNTMAFPYLPGYTHLRSVVSQVQTDDDVISISEDGSHGIDVDGDVISLQEAKFLSVVEEQMKLLFPRKPIEMECCYDHYEAVTLEGYPYDPLSSIVIVVKENGEQYFLDTISGDKGSSPLNVFRSSEGLTIRAIQRERRSVPRKATPFTYTLSRTQMTNDI